MREEIDSARSSNEGRTNNTVVYDQSDKDALESESRMKQRTTKPQTTDYLFLGCLFDFLNVKGEVNPTSAGYFCKIVDSLLEKCSDAVIILLIFGIIV